MKNQGIISKNLPEDGSERFLVGEGGFGPPKSKTTDLQSAPFGRSGIPPYSFVAKRHGNETLIKNGWSW